MADLAEARVADKLPDEPYMFCGWQEAAILTSGGDVQQDASDMGMTNRTVPFVI